jgi:hypothetical protein
MYKILGTVLVSIMLVVNIGCSANPIVGDNVQKAGRYSGNVRVVGSNTHLTIQKGSVVPKLSIVGDNCSVMVEDGVELGRIEFWGNGSTVNIPRGMNTWVSRVGVNSIVRHPPNEAAPTPNQISP